MTVLLAFSAFCVIAWGILVVIGIARIPDLICDAVEGVVGLWARVFAPNASEEAVKSWRETSVTLVFTMGVMLPLLGLVALLKDMLG